MVGGGGGGSEMSLVHLRINTMIRVLVKLKALVYDSPPSTTAVFSYIIGS